MPSILPAPVWVFQMWRVSLALVASGNVCALLVQVTLCAKTVKAYRLALVVDVDGVGEEIRTLPINARSDHPSSVGWWALPCTPTAQCFLCSLLPHPLEQLFLLTALLPPLSELD